MNERKEKIKSIAIVFLSIMLVLTFFSNTIMNYSLVEVSTQGVYGGSITTKVRGSGNVEATQEVSVEATAGRKIETINVKTGAEVVEGDVLFTLADTDSEELTAAKKALEDAVTAYEAGVLASGISLAERANIEAGRVGSLTDRQKMLDDTQATIDAAQANYDSISDQLEYLKNTVVGTDEASIKAHAEKEASLQNSLYEANKVLKNAQDYYNMLLTSFNTEMELGAKYEAIAEQRKKVKELEAEVVEGEIKAPMAGTITQINYYAGQTIKDNTVVMELKPENEAYTMQFTVSQTQSRRIKPGDPAEILYNWYDDEITARVATVQRDPMNRESYIVTCELFGDVNVGDYYTVSIGQQSSDYDYVVPTSCIREDSNGKFVLIIEAKSTPLGNRYYARRVDVEIITSDDSQSAITGAFDGYVYVITTTSKPVEENQQVRLAE